MAFKGKNKDEQNDEQATEQATEVSGERPGSEPADDRGDASRAEDENRVANNGEVHDAGNSGLIGEAFTEGGVTGQADKPNG